MNRALPCRPFLKWVGGKTQILHELCARCPREYGHYFEPFLGGGALFFALQPKKATLSDCNAELIQCYCTVRDRVEPLIAALKELRYEESLYYEVRERNPATLNRVEAAARTIYLNKTGFNGLYRVNKRGLFNVPFGRYSNPTICDEENLRACSAALSNVDIKKMDFEAIGALVKPCDFVYFDPPYAPVSDTSYFTSYAAGGFDFEAQKRLARFFTSLAAQSVAVLLSNSDVTSMRALYEGHSIEVVSATRNINSKVTRRGPVSEILVSGRGRTVSAKERKTPTKKPRTTSDAVEPRPRRKP